MTPPIARTGGEGCSARHQPAAPHPLPYRGIVQTNRAVAMQTIAEQEDPRSGAGAGQDRCGNDALQRCHATFRVDQVPSPTSRSSARRRGAERTQGGASPRGCWRRCRTASARVRRNSSQPALCALKVERSPRWNLMEPTTSFRNRTEVAKKPGPPIGMPVVRGVDGVTHEHPAVIQGHRPRITPAGGTCCRRALPSSRVSARRGRPVWDAPGQPRPRTPARACGSQGWARTAGRRRACARCTAR